MIGTAREAPIPNRHSDPVGPGPPDSEMISGPAPGFRSLRAAAAAPDDAHGFRHAFGKTAITFRPGIGIAYMTTFRNRHSEALVALDCRGDRTPFSSRKSIVSASEISIPAGDSRFFVATSPGSHGSSEVEGRMFFQNRPFSAVEGRRRRGPTAPPRVVNECARKWPISPPLTDCSYPLLQKKWA